MSKSRFPPGCKVEWCKEPGRQDRLLRWLEENPRYRQCIFFQNVEPELTHADCCALAALSIFDNDENPKNSAAVKKEPLPFAKSVRDCVYRWKLKYQEVNAVLGPAASKLPFEQFQRGSNLFKKYEEQMNRFPQWQRLHVFWRTLPRFNQYALEDSSARSSRSEGVIGKRRGGLSRKRKRESQAGSGNGVEVVLPARKRSTAPTLISNSDGIFGNKDESHDLIGSDITSKLTGDQIFQLKMAEIQCRAKKEENVARLQEQTERLLTVLLETARR